MHDLADGTWDNQVSLSASLFWSHHRCWATWKPCFLNTTFNITRFSWSNDKDWKKISTVAKHSLARINKPTHHKLFVTKPPPQNHLSRPIQNRYKVLSMIVQLVSQCLKPNTGSCVGPQNKIGQPAGSRVECWRNINRLKRTWLVVWWLVKWMTCR